MNECKTCNGTTLVQNPGYAFGLGTKLLLCAECNPASKAKRDRCLLRPGKKHDDSKLRYDLIPPVALKALAEVLTHGAEKYGPNNWQALDNFEARYTAALMRHLEAWRSGEKLDKDSGLPHLAHLLCNAVFLLWREIRK
jgi:hypothetical protein